MKAPPVHATVEQIYAEPGALDGREDGVVCYDEKDAFFGGVTLSAGRVPTCL